MDSYTPDIKLSLGDGFFFIGDPRVLSMAMESLLEVRKKIVR